MKRSWINGFWASSWTEWRKTVKINGIVNDYRRPRGDIGPMYAADLAARDGRLVWRDGHIDLP